MAYTQEGIMAQIWIAFGQGAGAIRVSQEAALELRRWYFDAITTQIIDRDGRRTLFRCSTASARSAAWPPSRRCSPGRPAITPEIVYESASLVQDFSDTDLCPPKPLAP